MTLSVVVSIGQETHSDHEDTIISANQIETRLKRVFYFGDTGIEDETQN